MIPPEAGPVHHHVCLERRGGATKAAKLLMEALGRAGTACSWSFEFAEEPSEDAPADPIPGLRLAPEALDRAPEGVFHLHATRGHLAALLSLAPRAGSVVLTAHDCSWLTGGCVFPMDCPEFVRGCGVCPRGYPEPGQSRVAKRRALEALAPVLVAPSGWMAKLLKAEFPGLAVKVAPNAVAAPDTLPDKAAAKTRLGVSPLARTALFLAHGGVDAGYKGGPRFVDIWERLKRGVPEAVGFIAGGTRHGREDDLIFWPYLEGGKLSLLFDASDVLVYPTLADNHPLAVLEAMAHGAAVVAYAVGGIPEQIPGKGFGLLAAPGNAEELASLAASLLASPHLAKTVSSLALERCRQLFSPQRLAKDTQRAYAALARPSQKNG
jgi:glycosyltransferase involved in cell wall biosynthesis